MCLLRRWRARARKRDDAFELLRAADPAARMPVPDPDSPEARALFARIIATPREPNGLVFSTTFVEEEEAREWSYSVGMDKNVIGVFEGGGIRGIASAGAAAAAMDAGYVFERVVGTSAGALVGSLVAAGFPSGELRALVCDVDWPGLLDADPFVRVPGIGRHLAMLRRNGIYKGKEIQKTWDELLVRRGIRTFTDLATAGSPTKSFRVIVTDVTHVRGLVLPDDLDKLGLDAASTPVSWAVRASAMVPFVFQPVRVVTKGHETLLIDGAMAANFGLRIVDLHAGLPILGFRFTTLEAEARHRSINGPLSFAAAVVASGIKARDALGSLPNIKATVIEVPAERDPLDFNITKEGAAAMFDEGYEATARQLSES